MSDKSETPADTAGEMSTADKIRAKREQLAAFRAERAVETAPEREARELARIERELRDEQQIAAAQKRLGADKVEMVYTDLGVVIVQASNPLVFSAYLDKGDSSSHEQMRLCLPCLVNLKASEFERICEALPLTLLRTTDALYLLAGAKQRDVAGKS